jgi:hypothetical protein
MIHCTEASINYEVSNFTIKVMSFAIEIYTVLKKLTLNENKKMEFFFEKVKVIRIFMDLIFSKDDIGVVETSCCIRTDISVNLKDPSVKSALVR